MAQAFAHLGGGGFLNRKYKAGATFSNLGVPTLGTSVAAGILPATTTSAADSLGLALDTTTYSTTQATVLASGEALVTVSCRPDLIIRSLMSGATTEGTALTIMTNTSASAGGTVLTATIQSADLDGGTLWCIGGNNVGQSRVVTTHTSTTSLTVTVPFPYAIAVGDTFLVCPWSLAGDGESGVDGPEAVTLTAAFYQANAATASGAGVDTSVYDLELNGTTDSAVLWINADHLYNKDT